MPDGGVRERYRATVEAIGAVQKSSAGAPLYSRVVNRPIGRRAASLAAIAGWTPNRVTALSATLTFAAFAVAAFVRPTPWVGVLISAGMVLGYGLDAADGQLARLNGTGSLAGEWLDHVVDCFKNSTVHLAVLVSFYRFSNWPSSILLLPALFSVAANAAFFTFILTEKLRPGGGPRLAVAGTRRPSIWRSLAVAPADYGVLCLAFLTFGWPRVFVWTYGALFFATAVYLGAGMVKRFREMSTLDSQRRVAERS